MSRQCVVVKDVVNSMALAPERPMQVFRAHAVVDRKGTEVRGTPRFSGTSFDERCACCGQWGEALAPERPMQVLRALTLVGRKGLLVREKP